MIEAHHLSLPVPKVHRARRKKKRLRQRIFWRDNGTCAYCQKKLKYDDCTLDHVISLVAGGSDKQKENFVLACWACNHKKGPLEMDHSLPENQDLTLDKLRNKWVSLDKAVR
jgi:5-methylcytosine-specific restriction endonuclease McrA